MITCFSCGRESQTHGESRSIDSITESAFIYPDSAYIAFDRRLHDFGTVKSSKTPEITIEIPFENTGNAPLFDFITNTPGLFDDDHSGYALDDHFDKFCYRWQDYAINELGWDFALIYYIAGTGEKMQTRDVSLLFIIDAETEDKDVEEEEEGGGSGPLCSCSTYQDFCDPTAEARVMCKTGGMKCDKKPKGCGWFLKHPCDGLCRGIID